mmetsp:Transcript_2915/g.3312  ORF Transcript_2915/g.3312 Transcript_2915/m.3312 type:complete len:122 (-) Transcript_2915:218-583(-)
MQVNRGRYMSKLDKKMGNLGGQMILPRNMRRVRVCPPWWLEVCASGPDLDGSEVVRRIVPPDPEEESELTSFGGSWPQSRPRTLKAENRSFMDSTLDVLCCTISNTLIPSLHPIASRRGEG